MIDPEKPRVAVLGAGVAGLSAAHELAERGFPVTVFEAAGGPGGKARSTFVPNTGQDGRRDLPGEHGFRFFPSFYRHLPDTMERIPFGRNARGVYDNLTATSRTRLARIDAAPVDVLTRFPTCRGDLHQLLRTLVVDDIGLPPQDALYLAGLFLLLLTSSPERRLAEHEQAPWWEFTGADRRSPAFRKYFADIAVRSLVAMCPRVASTRTVGTIGMQLWLDHARPGTQVDRLLDGPTQEVWINPWIKHLRTLGVRFRWHNAARTIYSEGRRITGVAIQTPNGLELIDADFYVAALPVERMRPLITETMREADPQLAGLPHLHTEWMTGVQFFLDQPLPIVPGHVVLVDAPWAVTAISQSQFWPRTNLSRFGDGRVRGVVSAIIANWDEPGRHVNKPARDCTVEEIREELWWQLKAHLRQFQGRTGPELNDHNLVDFYLADSVRMRGGRLCNREPLFINTAGSWRHRPEAVSKIENLFLASDYVRTNTDLATMESANEAARRAVNGLLDASGYACPRCEVWPLREPPLFRPLQHLDRQRWASGRPHVLATELGGSGGVGLANVRLGWLPACSPEVAIGAQGDAQLRRCRNCSRCEAENGLGMTGMELGRFSGLRAALSTTAGMSESAGSCFMALTTSQPLISGIIRSSRTTSGVGCALMTCRPSRPFVATWTLKPFMLSNELSASRKPSSSSTINTLVMGRLDRKSDLERAAFLRLALHRDCPSVRAYDLGRDVQPQSKTTVLAWRDATLERLEQSVLHFGQDSQTLIFNPQDRLHFVAGLLGLDDHSNGSLLAILQRVGHQVGDHLIDTTTIPVPLDGHWRVKDDGNISGLKLVVKPRQDGARRGYQVRSRACKLHPARPDGRHIQQVVDQSSHALALPVGRAGSPSDGLGIELGALELEQESLERQPQTAERGPQLVRGNRHEFFALADGVPRLRVQSAVVHRVRRSMAEFLRKRQVFRIVPLLRTGRDEHDSAHGRACGAQRDRHRRLRPKPPHQVDQVRTHGAGVERIGTDAGEQA